MTPAETKRGLPHRHPRSADRPAVREQHHPGEPHRSGGGARSSRCCPIRTRPAATTSSASRTSQDESDRYLGRVDLHLSRQRHACSAATSTAIASGTCRACSAAILDGTSTSAWGRNYLKSHGAVGGWTKVLGSTLVNEARFSYARGINDGTQDPFGENGNEQIGFRGVPNDPARRRRHRRHRHRRPHPARLAELHAEVPAHEPVPVDRHAQLGEGPPPGEVRRRRDAADEQRVLRRRPDARQPQLHHASTPATPSPTSCSATCSARS